MSGPRRPDAPTLLAIAVVAYALANVAHEGLGHGGACLLAGGRPVTLNAVYFDGEGLAEGSAGARFEAAGGTLVNLLLGVLSLALLRRDPTRPTPGRHFLWLFMTLNFLQATGYWLFSGLGRIGDWAAVTEGWRPAWGWRLGLTILGAGGYWLSIRLSLDQLNPLLGNGPDRLTRGKWLTLFPYLAGGALYVAAGLLNPLGMKLVLISAIAASFGGASALAWMTNLLHDRKAWPAAGGDIAPLGRSWPWIGAGLLAAVVFVGILGRGINF